MSKHVELPLTEPMYKTYHYQGICTSISEDNPSMKNWYLNQVMNLMCSRRFLKGYTTPEITIENSFWYCNPHIENKRFYMQFTKKHTNYIIRELLDKGYYVVFDGIDDYYVKGKSWYHEKHFIHDGLICGYDEKDQTFCIYAYDQNWIFRKFWVSQRDFGRGRKSAFKKGYLGSIYGIKDKKDQIEFSPKMVCERLKIYLNSSIENYPFDGEGLVYGIIVHEYIAEYVSRLINGSIPYERMDRRVFRLIWEHKKVMFERIVLLEKSLNLNETHSKQYKKIVSEADIMRMLYASHHMKRRDSVLPVIRKKLLELSNSERKILTSLLDTAEKEIEKGAVGISEK